MSSSDDSLLPTSSDDNNEVTFGTIKQLSFIQLTLHNAGRIPSGDSTASTRTISLRTANENPNNDVKVFERVLGDWYNDFYDSHSCRRRLRASQNFTDMIRLQQVEVVEQELVFDTRSKPTNTITFNMRVAFSDSDDSRPFSCMLPGNVDVNDLSLEEIAIIPFEDEDTNNKLAVKLGEFIDVLHDIESPIGAPKFQNQVHTKDDNDDEIQPDAFYSTILIIAISAGAGAAFICLLLLFLTKKDGFRKNIVGD